MDAALAVTAVLVAVALTTLAAFVLLRLLRTIVQLRRLTVGLHDVMRWTVGRMPAEPPATILDDAAVAPSRTLGHG